ILLQGKMGTLENLPEKVIVDNKAERSKYVDTCGALMRVMPIGFICAHLTDLDPFEFGCKSAAITHGDAASYLSAGITAELIRDLLVKKESFFLTLKNMQLRLEARKIF